MTEGEETAEKNKTDEEKKTEETEEKKDDEKVTIQKSYQLCCLHTLKIDTEHLIMGKCYYMYIHVRILFQEKAEEKPTEKIEDDVKLEKEKLAEAETPAAAPEVTA